MAAAAGCGVTYTSPKVSDRDPEARVNVVAMTYETVAEANRLYYAPRGIPAAFRQTAGTTGSVTGLGALPAPPDVPTERPRPVPLDPPPPIEAEPYRIGVGDVVLLATRGTASTIEQLSGLLAAQNQRQGYTVRDDGAIAIPEIGTVMLAGLTLDEAEAELFRILLENQIDPAFSLEVAEFNSQKVAIGGAVTTATLVPLGLRPVSLSDALTLAGGMAVRDEDFAVIRIYRDGRLYQIPVRAYLRETNLQNLLVRNGDAVFVDTTYDLDRALAFYQQQIGVISLRAGARSTALQALVTEINIRRQALEERRANFEALMSLDAVERDYVYLTGEVSQQARVALPFERMATLADVLYDEGGFDNTTGDPSEIYVLRSGVPSAGPGVVTAYHLDAKNAAHIIIATKMEMRPNDVVFIEEQPITKWGRSLQQLFPVLISRAAN
ncbi:MAG: polysaccharide biosynthesis/export family protein [Pseudomonadota bacterium]